MNTRNFLLLITAGVLATSLVHAGRFGSGGVKETYDAGTKTSGNTVYAVRCNSGGGSTAFQKSDGYWYDTSGNNHGDRYRNLSLSEFARKVCE